MLSRILLLLCLVLNGWQSASAGVVRIADGDCAGLASAVNSTAQTGDASIVLLARNGTYITCAFSITGGTVEIDGQGATLQYPLAKIASGASLALRNASIAAPRAGATVHPICNYPASDIGGIFHPASVAICNSGTLTLESVTVHDMAVGVPCSSDQNYCVIGQMIGSDGNLTLRNATLANFKGTFIFAQSGGVSIFNSTFTNFSASVIVSPKPSSGTANMFVANSLFDSGSVAACLDAGIFASLGGNIATESSCGFSSSTGDKIVASTALGTLDRHGGLIPTQAIVGGSPAKGAGNPQYCEALDARGYTRSSKGCDAGAYEFGAGSGALTENGMNGFYYDPDANGHYVSIQRIHDSGDVAIVWSAFDANGNQAWIYGIGHVDGKRIHADMSQNIGGILQPGGPPRGSTVRAWGTVDIDLTSCTLAQFNYASSLDGFGSGTFPLTRLAYVSDFGCAE